MERHPFGLMLCKWSFTLQSSQSCSAYVGSVAVLCCLLGCVEELLSLVWTYLLEREVTNLTIEELTEQRVQC